MKSLEEILQYNEKFVEEKKYEEYETGKFPNKKMVIISCMDTRLVELLCSWSPRLWYGKNSSE